MVDLGSWMGENYRIPERPEDQQQPSRSGDVDEAARIAADGREKKTLH